MARSGVVSASDTCSCTASSVWPLDVHRLELKRPSWIEAHGEVTQRTSLSLTDERAIGRAAGALREPDLGHRERRLLPVSSRGRTTRLEDPNRLRRARKAA